MQEAKEPAKKAASKGIIGALFGMLVPVVVRAAQGYAVQYFETWLAQQQHALAGLGARRLARAGGPGRPASPGQTTGPGRPPTPGMQPPRPPAP